MVTLKRETSWGRAPPYCAADGVLIDTSLKASLKLRSIVETDGGRVDCSGAADGAAIGRRACTRCDGREFMGDEGWS